jgi:hypothetical protein
MLRATGHQGVLMTDEFIEAYKIADKVLDRPSADPDDDVAVLARQFQRAVEKLGICLTRGPLYEERVVWWKQVSDAIESVLTDEERL